MKLVTLNTWGGRLGKETILPFFEKYRDDIDVFCFQEVFAAAYEGFESQPTAGLNLNKSMFINKGMQLYKQSLGGSFSTYYHPHFYDLFGLMVAVRKIYPVDTYGDVFVHKYKTYEPTGDTGNHARNIQYIQTKVTGKKVTVLNFHGLWNGKGKTDSEDRIQQSRKIISFLETLDGEIVFCGDFNLRPDTKSLQMFENFGLTNLITEFGITSTRTSHYKNKEKYADYVFVSKGIKVKDFKVLPEEISDHSALFLEFE